MLELVKLTLRPNVTEPFYQSNAVVFYCFLAILVLCWFQCCAEVVIPHKYLSFCRTVNILLFLCIGVLFVHPEVLASLCNS